MNKSKSKKDSLGIAQIEESTALFERAKATIGLVPRLSPQERRRRPKAPHGALGIIPAIAALSAKYGFNASEMNGDALQASFARLEALDSLLAAAEEAYTTANDARFIASCQLWASARMLYGMMSTCSATHAELAEDLKPVTEWFAKRKATEPSVLPAQSE